MTFWIAMSLVGHATRITVGIVLLIWTVRRLVELVHRQ